MSGIDDIDAIRRRKREELAAARRDADPGAEIPTEPVQVRGADHLGELADRHQLVLVDFHADWCGPCQMLEPIVAEIARETDAVVAKVDIDTHQELATDAGVRSVPTLFLYVDGQPTERLVGLQDAATLRDLVEQHA